MQETYNDLWRNIAGRIRPHLSADAFQRWFAAIELVQADETALTLKVPNSIYQFWIESNFLNVVQAAAVSVLKRPREIRSLPQIAKSPQTLSISMLGGRPNRRPLYSTVKMRSRTLSTG